MKETMHCPADNSATDFPKDEFFLILISNGQMSVNLIASGHN
jgi:hypothetical protein